VFKNLSDDQNRAVCEFFVGFGVAAHVKESTCPAFGFIL
jgi:hypothetical protein